MGCVGLELGLCAARVLRFRFGTEVRLICLKSPQVPYDTLDWAQGRDGRVSSRPMSSLWVHGSSVEGKAVAPKEVNPWAQPTGTESACQTPTITSVDRNQHGREPAAATDPSKTFCLIFLPIGFTIKAVCGRSQGVPVFGFKKGPSRRRMGLITGGCR